MSEGEDTRTEEPPAQTPAGSTLALTASVVVSAVGAFVVLASVTYALPAWLATVPIGVLAALSLRGRVSTFLATAILFSVAAVAADALRVSGTVFTWQLIASCAVAAGLVALATRLALDASPARTAAVTWVAIAVLTATVMTSSYHTATSPRGDQPSMAENLSKTPIFTGDLPDEALHYFYVIRVAEGTPYYVAVRDTLLRANAARDTSINVHTPLSFRPPLVYVMLGQLPRNGVAYVIAVVVMGLVAAAAAYVLARRLAAPSVALLSALIVFAYFDGVAKTPALFGTETWAGALALVAISLFVVAAERPAAQALVPMFASALIAVLAVATRELAVAFIVLCLGASLLDRDLRKAHLWVPWSIAALAAAVVLLLHWSSAAEIIRTIPGSPRQIGGAAWLHLDGLGLVSGALRLGGLIGTGVIGGWLAIVLGSGGSVLGSRRTATRTVLVGAVIGGAIVVATLYPTGINTAGLPPGYWFDLVAPTTLACAPLVLSRVLPQVAPDVAPEART